MKISKIVGIALIALAVVAAFVNIPYIALILAVVGAVMGWGFEADAHVRVIVSALALHAFSGLFDTLPTVGPYLTKILGNVAIGVGGAAIAIIVHNIVRRLTK